MSIIALGCLLKRWYVASVFLLVVMLVVNWHWQVVAFGFQFLPEQKTENGLRMMEWNVDCTNERFDSFSADIYRRIQEYDPDVLFLTEYSIDKHPLLDSLLRSDFGFSWSRDNDFTSSVIYCNKAVKDCRFADPTGKWVNIIKATIAIGEDSVMVYGCHMYSNNFGITPADSLSSMDEVDTYLSNYKLRSKDREVNATMVVEVFNNDRNIVMGDMNDVAGSLPLKAYDGGGLNDAWWEGGYGYGATIHKPLPYRIDHVLYSKGLKLKGIKKVDNNGLSDYDALVVDFEIE